MTNPSPGAEMETKLPVVKVTRIVHKGKQKEPLKLILPSAGEVEHYGKSKDRAGGGDVS